MGSDLYALSALAQELNTALCGARIDKIQQPEVDELRFFMRAAGKNLCLVASCNASVPRLHITLSKKQSPLSAPNFCMLLRKHLINLFVEIMNRYSNIVFTDENLNILDAIKHLPLDMAREHIVVRGVRYEPVPQPKISYLNDCFSVLSTFESGDLRKFILSNISGFSGTTVSELLFRAQVDEQVSDFDGDMHKRLEKEIMAMRSLNGLSPCIINGEVYPTVYKCLQSHYEVKTFDSMSEAYDALNTDIDGKTSARSHRKKHRH